MTRPIIITLQFHAAAADFFEAERRRHFPPALNRIPAHLTLFHALPGEAQDEVMRACAETAARPAFRVNVDGLMALGRGVAYAVSGGGLLTVRADLARRFDGMLTRQDREKFRPHVTVQNKVDPQEARALKAELERTFAPFTATAEGLQLWHYDGGPWSPIGAVGFARGG